MVTVTRIWQSPTQPILGISTGHIAILLGAGRGTFREPVDYPVGSTTPNSLALADGDGRQDLAVANVGKGDGTFQPVNYPVGAAGSNRSASWSPTLTATGNPIWW